MSYCVEVEETTLNNTNTMDKNTRNQYRTFFGSWLAVMVTLAGVDIAYQHTQACESRAHFWQVQGGCFTPLTHSK